MHRTEDYSKLIGFIVFALALILLLSSPSMLLAKTVDMIGTELSYITDNEQTIRVKMDLGNSEHVRTFPASMNGWTSSDYDTTRLAENLDADTMLMRSYIQPNSIQPVFFLIMHSDNRSSFHPPIICYPALGYTIVEEGTAIVPVNNESWAEEKPLYKTWEDKAEELGFFNETITVKKLIVIKESDGEITERRIVLYFYVKNSFLSADDVTMIRVSAVAPTNGAYDETMNTCKDFMGKTIPYLFEKQQEEDSIAISLAKSGLGGWILIVVILAVPFLIMFYPELKRKIT